MPKDSRSPSRKRSASKSRSRSKSGGRKPSRSASRSRSRSRSRGDDKNGDDKKGDYGVETIKLTDGDAAFLLGKQGKTKNKIAKVSGAELEMYERDLKVEIKGTARQRRLARKYAECVMAQRVGPVTLSKYDGKDGDETHVDVPQECVGFVTGRGGNFLRQLEEEWCVIMFFVEFEKEGSRRKGHTERLAIFGNRRGRRGAELKVKARLPPRIPMLEQTVFFLQITREFSCRSRRVDGPATVGANPPMRWSSLRRCSTENPAKLLFLSTSLKKSETPRSRRV
jgi:hypothetical protein